MINEDYLSCNEYENQSAHPTADNFTVFHHQASQRYFFALLDADNKVLLKSEGYPQQAARENGIQSVLKNSLVGTLSSSFALQCYIVTLPNQD